MRKKISPLFSRLPNESIPFIHKDENGKKGWAFAHYGKDGKLVRIIFPNGMVNIYE